MWKSNENVDTGGSGINKYLIKELKNKNIVSNSVRIHHLASLLSTFSVKFHIVSDAVRMHHLASLFSKFSLQFQIISNAVKMHPLPSLHVFKIISVILNCFKYRQTAPFTVIVFKISRRLPWSSCFPLVLVQHMYYFSYWSFKYRSKRCQKAIFSDLVLKMVQAVPNPSK